MILVIDNYDSFTFNLVQYLGELGAELTVHRNDELTVGQIQEMCPDAVVVSPGPCTPAEAGVSVEVIRQLGPTTPVLGVCLGHQAIGAAFGGKVIRGPRLMHGKTSPIVHSGTGIFTGLPSPLTVARYHSLVIDPENFPDQLEVLAHTDEESFENEIQAVRHREFPVWGVQFHPESIASEHGLALLQNFLDLI
ncbi:MAG: aminodeoxychorismate/anthranilate synthase component II [Gemmatimonadota bacterium]|nr:aminodeoxychorismate/anthranilate synthase component II [Gemmatimonadota bacterium]